MATVEMTVQKRDAFGKNAMNRLRAKGVIPAILYGHREAPLALSVTESALKKVVQQGENLLLTLKIEGEAQPETVLIKALQRHPVRDKIIHVDFYRVSLTEKIVVRVPLHITGEAGCPGLRDGGILAHHLREVEVRCLPTAIPAFLSANITGLKIGDSLHVSHLETPSGVEILTPATETILAISAPTEVAGPAAEAAGPAQPEVIGEKEREERRAAADQAKEERKKEQEEAKT